MCPTVNRTDTRRKGQWYYRDKLAAWSGHRTRLAVKLFAAPRPANMGHGAKTSKFF